MNLYKNAIQNSTINRKYSIHRNLFGFLFPPFSICFFTSNKMIISCKIQCRITILPKMDIAVTNRQCFRWSLVLLLLFIMLLALLLYCCCCSCRCVKCMFLIYLYRLWHGCRRCKLVVCVCKHRAQRDTTEKRLWNDIYKAIWKMCDFHIEKRDCLRWLNG